MNNIPESSPTLDSLSKIKKTKFDWLIYIGRFQPFHSGHLKVVDIASSISNNVLLLIGSAQSPRTIKNPFTFHERQEIIRKIYRNENRVHIKGLSVFIPLAFLDANGLANLRKRKVYRIYEYIDKASPKAINGYPIFTSFQTLTEDETKILNKYHQEYISFKKDCVKQK